MLSLPLTQHLQYGSLAPIHRGKLWAYFRRLSGQEIHASGATFGTEQICYSLINSIIQLIHPRIDEERRGIVSPLMF